MANRDMLDLDVGTVIQTSYDGPHLEAQFDSEGDEGTAPAEVLSPFGFDARPRDPQTDGNGTAGLGATAICATEGRKQHMLLFGDPRATASLPTLEKGSARMYAHLGGDKVAWLRIDGATGSFKLRVPVGSGETTVEVNASTGDVTLTHQAGTSVVVKAASVEIAGTQPLALSTPIETWAAGINSAITALGGSAPALVGAAATKVKGS